MCLCFQSFLTNPNCLEGQTGLAGQGFAVRPADSPAPLVSISVLWLFPARARAGGKRRKARLFLYASIVLTLEPYLNQYAGCHRNTNKYGEERHVPLHFIPVNRTQLQRFPCLVPHVPGPLTGLPSRSAPTATSAARTHLLTATSPN